jgi:hypothetical protein
VPWLPLQAPADPTAAKENVFETKPLGIKVSIKMIGPYTQPADLQIICLFKHKSSGDTYQGAAKETDAHLGGILSALRNRGEFVGELGETFLFTPPSGTIPAKRFMVIGLGDEKDLSLNSLKLSAASPLVRRSDSKPAMLPGRRSFATKATPTIDVGQGDRAFVGELLSAYDTEKRLQDQGLADKFSIEDVVIEAGRHFSTAPSRRSEKALIRPCSK